MAFCTGPFISEVELPGHKEPGLNFTVLPDEPMEVRLLRPWVLASARTLGYTGLMDAAGRFVQSGEVRRGAGTIAGTRW